MNQNTLVRLKVALQECKATVKDVTNESDDVSFAIGFEHGANLVITQIESIIKNQLILK